MTFQQPMTSDYLDFLASKHIARYRVTTTLRGEVTERVSRVSRVTEATHGA